MNAERHGNTKPLALASCLSIQDVANLLCIDATTYDRYMWITVFAQKLQRHSSGLPCESHRDATKHIVLHDVVQH